MSPASKTHVACNVNDFATCPGGTVIQWDKILLWKLIQSDATGGLRKTPSAQKWLEEHLWAMSAISTERGPQAHQACWRPMFLRSVHAF